MKQTSRLRPDVVAYTSLLTALQGTQKVRKSRKCNARARHLSGILSRHTDFPYGWEQRLCWGSSQARRPAPLTLAPLLLNALHLCLQAAATARELWSSMQGDGVQPNGMAVAAFLEILLLEGEVDEALQVCSCCSCEFTVKKQSMCGVSRGVWCRRPAACSLL